MKILVCVCVLSVFVAAPALAQMGAASARSEAAARPAADSITAGTKAVYDMVKGYVTASAAAAPEAVYAFKPTPEVRSFGQIIGHVADANYMICSAAAAEKSPAGGDVEKTKTTKADLVKALGESFAYCDTVYARMNDTSGAETVKFMLGGDMAKLSILAFNTAHDFEHYGNLVTYMRLNKMVPPSSQGRGGMAP
jgi:uncharacterized damage-inducible protein DinB